MVKMGVMALVFAACGGAGVPVADADVAMGFVPTRGSEPALSPVSPVDAAPVAVSPVDAAPVVVSPVDAAPVAVSPVDAAPVAVSVDAVGEVELRLGKCPDEALKDVVTWDCDYYSYPPRLHCQVVRGPRSLSAAGVAAGACVTGHADDWWLEVDDCSQCAARGPEAVAYIRGAQ
jgi:hypothetical protein